MAVETLKLDVIESKACNLYEAAMLIAKRARQINTEINEQIKAHLGDIEIDEESGEESVDRESIISEFDKKAKPTSMAVEELMNDKLEFKYVEEED